MRNKPKGPLELATLGALPTLALIATALPATAQAQIRGRVPTVVAPERQGPVIRRGTPAAETNCPDPIQARRDGRSVPAGCPGAQEEQAPVAVQYREQSAETPATTERGARPVSDRRIRGIADTPLADQPLNDGRVRRRIPGARTPDDGAMQEAAPDRPSPVRRRDDYVARTPDEIAPRREVTPDRPPPIRRRDDYIARTPDEVPDEVTPVRPNPVRRRDDYVARTPDEVDTREPTPVRPNPVRRRDDYVAETPQDTGPRRVYLPGRDGPIVAEPVRPVRPVRPVAGGGGGGLPDTPAGGVAGQLECIAPRANTTIATNIDITKPMLCGFPGPGKAMSLRFKPEQWRVVSGSYSNGSAARVTFGTPVNGVYPVISVAEGRQARTRAVCVPVHAAYNASNTLTVGAPGAAVKPHRMWCTADGKVARPLDMGWFTGSMYIELIGAAVEDGPIDVGYFDISTPATLDTVQQLGPYPQLGTNWSNTTAIADQAKVNNQNASSKGFLLTYAKPPLTGQVMRCVDNGGDIVAGICRGYRRVNSNPIWTAYRAYAPPAIRSASERPAKADEIKQVYFTLMPGIIPAQYRAEAGGACRVILAIEVDIKPIPGKVGEGYADGQAPQFAAPGTVTGVASGPLPVTPPKADDCI